jgi:DNA-binding NarL/FixJ family response regulator
MQATFDTTFQRISAGLSGSLLFVEDNDYDFIVACHQIRKLKITNPIQQVRTTEEMLDYLGGFDQYADRDRYPVPAIVFVNLRLPDSSGIGAQALIRTNARYRNTPVIAIGDHGHVNSLRSAVALGANGYMLKPFDGKELARILSDQDIWLHIEPFDKVTY